jgi:peptide deformylase
MSDSRAYDDPDREARRQLALQHVRQFGDPVLRTPAARVEVFDDALAEEVAMMMDLMDDARGVGLAAPQIGRLRRVIVIHPAEGDEPQGLINPEITAMSEETEVGPEGCLSIGEIVVPVERSVVITVRAQNVAGESEEFTCDGFPARVIQHEVDHLNGVLILDRTTPDERREALRQLRDGVA